MAYRFTSQSLQRFIPNIPDIPNKSISPSSISQARDKVTSHFYKKHFQLFNSLTCREDTNLFHGYRLIAVDGSEIRVLSDSSHYDIPFDVTLTSKNHSYVKQHWDTYKYISSYKKHPEFTKETTKLPLNIRVVRYKAVSEGKESSITVATNLPTNEFDTESIKEIYRLRWQEEISFDEIKHLMDLDTIHSKKMEKILSEIYAKLTLYNLCSRIRNALEQRKKKKKYIHKLDFRFLIDRVREILLKKFRKTWMIEYGKGRNQSVRIERTKSVKDNKPILFVRASKNALFIMLKSQFLSSQNQIFFLPY